MRGRSTIYRYDKWITYVVCAGLVSVLIIGAYAQFVARAISDDWAQANFTSISTGDTHTCGIESGLAYCWGSNDNGQLGDNSTTLTNAPVAVAVSGALSGKTVTAIAAGTNSTCAIASGAAYCWGLNTNGQLGNNSTTQSLVPVAVDTSGVLSGKTITAISVGSGSSACAIASGAAYCWGLNTNGRLGNNSTTQSLVPVAVTASGVLSGKTITAISVGNAHACAVGSSTAYCWGSGVNGRLGNNSTTQSLVPVAVTASGVLSGKTITAIAAGTVHSCAIGSGAAYCWGFNSNGYLGNNSTTQSLVPVTVTASGVLSGKTMTAISVGNAHSCAVGGGAAYCWGANSVNGALGNNSSLDSLVPVAVTASGVLSGKTVTAISGSLAAAGSYSCAVGSGAAYCWGYNGSGQLGGSRSTTRSPVPITVKVAISMAASSYRFFGNANSTTPGSPLAATDQSTTLLATGSVFRLRTGVTADVPFTAVTNLSVGFSHGCALGGGAPYCWGEDTNDRLGTNFTGSITPYPVNTTGTLAGKTISAISAGSNHSCAIASSAAYCWGLNTNGQLGNNSTTQSSTPVAVDTSGVLSGKTVTAIAASGLHTCAVASGAVYCWGYNANGQLGNNSSTQSLVPVAVDTSGVLSGKTMTAISASTNNYSCAIGGGAAYCWGINTNGQLGNNSTSQSLIPVAVDTSGVLSGVTMAAITTGSNHTCAIGASVAYCWGGNANGQLGNNSSIQSLVPAAVYTAGVLSGKTISAITAGSNYSCAVGSSAAYCWGVNTNGQLGNNSTAQSIIAVAVDVSGILSGKTVTAIAASSNSIGHSCTVASSVVACWGYNSNGQLGNNTLTQSLVPVGAVAVSRSVPAQKAALKLQYALKTAATCSSQVTGFNAVTATSAIAWNVNAGVADGAAITSTANDPTLLADTVYQSYVSGGTTLANSNIIIASKHSLWDFSLKDNSGLADTTYCLRVVYAASDTPLEKYNSYPEVKTAPPGLTMDFVDNTGVSVASPTFSMQQKNLSGACQTASTTLGSAASNRLRIKQSGGAGNGWNVSVAPLNGSVSLWSRNDAGAYYDFNDPSGSPAGCNSGSDGDGYAGQLTLGLSTTTVAPQAGCSLTGLSTGSTDTAFADSIVSAITLTSASSSAQANCYWDIYDTGISQTIPPGQVAGQYAVALTATVVAQ